MRIIGLVAVAVGLLTACTPTDSNGDLFGEWVLVDPETGRMWDPDSIASDPALFEPENNSGDGYILEFVPPDIVIQRSGEWEEGAWEWEEPETATFVRAADTVRLAVEGTAWPMSDMGFLLLSADVLTVREECGPQTWLCLDGTRLKRRR